MSDLPNTHEQLGEAVKKREARRALWQSEGERAFGHNLVMIGALGWTVVAPLLGGVFLGRWLDRYFNQGVFWTLGLLVAGLAVGCSLAWRRINGE